MDDGSHPVETRELDGNAVAGDFDEIFRIELITAQVTCRLCGSETVLATARVFTGGPGTVLRCRTCEGVQVRIARRGNRIYLDMSGVSVFAVDVPSTTLQAP